VKSRRASEFITYAALERTAMNIVAVQLANSHRSVLVRIHLDEGESAVGLETGLDDVTKVLEQRHKIILRRVGGEISNVASRLPSRRLADNHVIAVDSMGWEVVMAIRRGRRHAHLLHGLLLSDRGLALLVCPIAADGPGTKPFAIHRTQCLLGVGAVTEGHEAVAARAAGLHIPHDASFGDGSEG